MKRFAHYSLVVQLIVFCLVCGYAFYVKASIKPVLLQKAPATAVVGENASVRRVFHNDWTSFNELQKKASFIAEVKMEKRLHYVMYGAVTQLTVLKTYKGEAREHVKMIEPAYFTKQHYGILLGYKPLEFGKRYLVFLQERDLHPTYKSYLPSEEQQYLLPLSTAYSVYPLHSQWQPVAIDYGKQKIQYAQIKQYDIVTNNVKVAQQYSKFRAEAYRHYSAIK